MLSLYFSSLTAPCHQKVSSRFVRRGRRRPKLWIINPRDGGLATFYREYLTDIVDPAFESQRTQYHPDLQLGALQLLAFDGEMSQLNAVYERLGINPKEQFDAGAPQGVEARSPSPDSPPDLPPSVVPDSEDDSPASSCFPR